MKKIILALVLSLVACAQSVYKVGVSPGYPPFEYKQNGELVGFDIDLVNAISKELGIKVEFVEMDFDGLISAIKMGKIDIIASGMTKTPQRAKSVEFTKPYYESVNYYVKHKENTNLNSIKDLEKGTKVGAQLGTIQADEISKIKGVTPFLNADHIVFIMATKQKQIDAFVLESAVAKGYMKQYDEFEVFAKTNIKGDGISIAFKKGNVELAKQFDDAIDKLKENGVYDELLKKYDLVQ